MCNFQLDDWQKGGVEKKYIYFFPLHFTGLWLYAMALHVATHSLDDYRDGAGECLEGTYQAAGGAGR